MLALAPAAFDLPMPGALPRPAPLAASPAVPPTELGGVIHFPEYLDSTDWPAAEAALDRLKLTLGPHAYVRWDGLWHTTNWNVEGPRDYARIDRIVGLLAKRGLRSLIQILPHPWPGSQWDDGKPTTRDWGAPKPEWFAEIALRYREEVVAYREALKRNGMPEAANAVQWGNEPASGHPGGNEKLARGTWSGHALWRELNRDPSFYGALQVVSPALSMMEEPVAPLELATSRIPKGLDWTGPVDRRAMHFRYFQPIAASPAAYAQGYVDELKRRAAIVLAQPWPKGSPSKLAARRDGVWVTEGYVVPGDAPGRGVMPLANSWRRVLTKVRAGVPGVRVFFAYRFFPVGGPGGLDWRLPLEAQKPLSGSR